MFSFHSISDGREESVMFDKITSRISKLCYHLNQDFVDPVRVEEMLVQLNANIFMRGKKKQNRTAYVNFQLVKDSALMYCCHIDGNWILPTFCISCPQAAITLKVINGLYPGVTTQELDNLAAETAATMTTKHPDYAILAARIAVSNLHKETKKVFSGEYLQCGLIAAIVTEKLSHVLLLICMGRC